jgi:hypothetical protein
MLADQNQIALLIENRNLRSYQAVRILIQKIDDFESRIECVSRMNLLQKLAGDFGEGDEYFPDVLRE